jgi:hypothetical protein
VVAGILRMLIQAQWACRRRRSRAYDAAMEDALSATKTLNDIISRAIAALEAGEIALPAIADDPPGIQAFHLESDAVPGLGIVSDGRGLRILMLTVEEARRTAEYTSQHENYLALFTDVDDTAAAGEVFLEEIDHEFLHDAYEAPSLNLFLRRNLLPHLVEIWALIDAYAMVVHGKLPERGDQPLVITRETLAEIDPYAEGGLILAMQIWDHTASELHDARVHSPLDPRDDFHLSPIRARAQHPAARPEGS